MKRTGKLFDARSRQWSVAGTSVRATADRGPPPVPRRAARDCDDLATASRACRPESRPRRSNVARSRRRVLFASVRPGPSAGTCPPHGRAPAESPVGAARWAAAATKGSLRSRSSSTCLRRRAARSPSRRASAPRAKISVRASASAPSSCSGAMYWIVPTTVPSAVSGFASVSSVGPAASPTAPPRRFARPKSRSFAPAFVSIMFPGLRSRWTMPARGRRSTHPRSAPRT